MICGSGLVESNPTDRDHFNSAMEARKCIDSEHVSFEKVKSFMAVASEDSEEKKHK